ncbi:uncharacterized protein LOC134825211 isoform X2 [Bolinopsis microptera]|uniref:uncharacterized protein LOC134825211 isoform X2 n=1 Tax=Bolinopsis microptera TaxID=2820187 RepID=UPI00307B0750
MDGKHRPSALERIKVYNTMVKSFFKFMFVMLLFSGTSAAEPDWREMKTGKIDYDLQNSPLKIRTDSPFESGDEVKLTFFALNNQAAGGLRIKLDTTLKYYLTDCDNSYTDAPTSLPSNLLADGRKIWKITKTPEPGMIVHCNEHEILKIQLSDTICTNQNKWSEIWSRKAKKIQFNSYFREYDYYYHPTECTGLDANWYNVLSDQDFPIVEGTVLTLSCRGGEEIEGDKTVICVKDTEYQYTEEPTCYWKPVVSTNTKIDYDLENFPLRIKTDSSIGSKNRIAVYVYSSGDQLSAGRIQIHLMTKPRYSIDNCRTSWTELTTSLPEDDNRVWRITKTSNPIGITIDCNDKEILNFKFSEETCTSHSTSWMTYWDKEMKKINFHGDTASDFYQHPPECTGLNANWNNVLSDQDFPIVEGTVLTLSCRGGEEIEGDKTVICVKDTEYTFSLEPTCYWQTVEKNKLIEYDLENSPLRIKTDSAIGSRHAVYFQTFSFDSKQIGRISIHLATVPKYYIRFCRNSAEEFPVSLPASDNDDRVWKITKLSQPVRVIIHCDNTEILHLQLSDSICSSHKANWKNYWGKDIKRIKFISDTASDFFLPAQVSECAFSSEPTCTTSEKQCTGFKATWTNMITTTMFPVIQGTELSLSCEQGYGLKGDDTVTCVTDTEFTAVVEPLCVEQCHNFKQTWRNMLVPAGKKLPVFKGTVLDLKCERGYQMSGDTTVTCEMNTEFTYENDPPQCTAVCDGVTPTWSTTNMVPTPESVFPITKGATLIIRCEPGYERSGDKKVTCDQFQIFTFSAEPLCSACPAGKYRSDDIDICQQCEGETYSTGNAGSCTSCLPGTANEEKTACAGFCPQLTVLNANISPSGTVEEGLVATITCSRRFLLIGSKTAMTCKSDGSWEGDKPHCKKIGACKIYI